MTHVPSPTHRLVATQILVVAAVLVGVVLAPPERGALLLVPLLPVAGATTIDVALAHGAALGKAGPLAGSLVVRGERARLFAPLLARGVLTIAAPAIWCGR